jgi:WD40-like Beta Propeller Repeat
VGIARRPLSQAASIPVLSTDGAHVAALDDAGNVLLGEPGKPLDIVASGALPALPGTKRPAHLLWQPHAEALVYPVGATRALGTFTGLLDAAFTPDGAKLLVHTSDGFALRSLDAAADAPPLFSWREPDAHALAWWSPDGSMLLVRDTGGLKLVDVGRRTVTDLLSAPAGGTGETTSGAARAFWNPTVGSPWSADGTRIVFASNAGATWRGSPLAKPAHGDVGLYIASVRDGAAPALIDSNADTAPSWGYLDPSTVFLAGA